MFTHGSIPQLSPTDVITGHGEAAVSLQQTWYPDPQNLPFARHIKTHALVSLMQKGLQYHELESSIDKEGNPVDLTPSDYFFGPEPLELLKSRDFGTDHPTKDEPSDLVTNGHPPNPMTGDAMYVDADAETDADVEAEAEAEAEETAADSKTDAEHESKASPKVDGDGDVSMATTTLNSGQSIGVQISPAKAADLSPNTARLDLMDHVMFTAWKPRDPTILLSAGETFCSLWKLSSSEPVQNKFLDLKNTGAYVSAVAWDGIGANLAIATMRDSKGTITFYNDQGNAVDLLPDLPRMISGLHWALQSPQLIIVASDERTSELALWDNTERPDAYPNPLIIDNNVFDLGWAGKSEAFACGTGTVYQCEVDQTIRLINKFTSANPDTIWSYIRCAETNNGNVAVTASSTTSTIWIPTHDILIETNQDVLTAIDIQPQSPAQRRAWSITGKPLITIASYSVDGTVGVWEVDLVLKQYKRVHRLKLGVPVLAGGFSSDGYALGAVSQDRLALWNVERGGEPVATWSAAGSKEVKEEPDHFMNGQNGGLTSQDVTLSWDHDGKKLAYGFRNQVTWKYSMKSSSILMSRF
ncbi:hypothetical protein N7495_003579 [Penicillium taxi]|uniref:uncharacterized protein n=1 Tax=Penicillium taxi TaxID=168475 RepID=UPI0025451361|nr:uncharacterized protein N7495_003579 [Penicillium taxi]KAJ5898835.1 hypothetical protein N7495_003579 [Penicillium taxi]